MNLFSVTNSWALRSSFAPQRFIRSFGSAVQHSLWSQRRESSTATSSFSRVWCDQNTGECALEVTAKLDKKIWRVASEQLTPNGFVWEHSKRRWVAPSAGASERVALEVQRHLVELMGKMDKSQAPLEEASQEMALDANWMRQEEEQSQICFQDQFDMENPEERERANSLSRVFSEATQVEDKHAFWTDTSLNDEEKLKLFINDVAGTVGMLLPQGIDGNRFLKLVSLHLKERKDLFKFDVNSVRKCVFTAAMLGLDPGVTEKYCYFLPFKNKLCFVIGYRGLMELTLRTGAVVSFTARSVYKEDQFDFSDNVIQHTPSPSSQEKGELTMVYVICVMKDGRQKVLIVSRSDFTNIKRIAKRMEDPLSPWFHWTEEMWLKTALKRMLRSLKASPEKRTS